MFLVGIMSIPSSQPEKYRHGPVTKMEASGPVRGPAFTDSGAAFADSGGGLVSNV